MKERKYLSGKLTPIDINSEEFKKKCKKEYSEMKKRGYTIITDSKELANIPLEELIKTSKNGVTISIDIDLSNRQ